MENSIQFKISYDKAIEAIVFLANKKPGIHIYHVAKILFFADKMHVNKYGRPVTGDTYIKMPYGPVPSGIRDLITKNTWLSPKQSQGVQDSLEIDDKANYKMTAKRSANLDYFSKSDIDALEISFDKYAELSFDELYNITHSEKSFIETDPREKIDYALLVDDNNPDRFEIISHMREISPCVQV